MKTTEFEDLMADEHASRLEHGDGGADSSSGEDFASRAPWTPPTLKIDLNRERFPFCLVWTPIPCLTAFLPFVGHLGIADSRGITFDFAGPYTITVDSLLFGRTTRYIQCFDAKQAADRDLVDKWDKAIYEACQEYTGRMHNLCWDNCHSHVGFALRLVGYKRYNMVWLAAWIFFAGRFASLGRFLYTVVPSLILYGILLLLINL